MTTYEVTLHVEEDHLPAVIGVVKGSAVITGVHPLEGVKPKKNFRFAGGKRDKGIKSEDLIMKIVSDGQIHGKDEFDRTFAELGFAHNTVSAALSKVMQLSKIDRVGPHSYCKAGALPQLKRGAQ